MIKSLALVAAAWLGMNKLAYHYFLKSPKKMIASLEGKGRYTTLMHNPYNHSWICAYKSDDFQLNPQVKLHHMHDLYLDTNKFPSCFRIRACHESINFALQSLNLSELDISLMSRILLSHLDDIEDSQNSNLIRLNLWQDAGTNLLTFSPVPRSSLPETISLIQPNTSKPLYSISPHTSPQSPANFHLFFSKSNKIFTQESTYSISPYPIVNSVMRDSIIKLTNSQELSHINPGNYDFAFLSNDSFSLYAVSSIQSGSNLIDYDTEASLSLIKSLKLSIVITKKQEKTFKSLAEDKFSVEYWHENLRTISSTN